MREFYRVKPGAKVDLADFHPDETPCIPDDIPVVKTMILENSIKLQKIQERMYAEHIHKVLFVFQAADCGGKDGAIEKLCSGMNPAGVHVAAFKSPSKRELEHDYLWRVHHEVPRNGHIGIFNRSHYEDVLFPRVHEGMTSKVAERRFGHINDFERMMSDEGMTIVKFFLHISKEEQKRRLEARRDDPEKRWKLEPADLKERKFWNEYQKFYSEALSATSTKYAPWYIIPANNKKKRDLILSTIALKTLQDLGIRTPRAVMDVSNLEIV